MNHRIDRRSLLLTGTLGIGALALPGVALAQAAARGFTHSVASGEPGPDTMLLWTRYVPADRGAVKMAQWAANSGFAVDVVAGSDLPDDLEGPIRRADVVCCATTSRYPLFDSRWLGDEACVVAVGSHEPDAREVDSDLVARATVVVEGKDSALREAGDIIMPIRDGEVSADVIAGDLPGLVKGWVHPVEGRPRFFKSCGEAWEDLVVAGEALDRLIGDTAARGIPLGGLR